MKRTPLHLPSPAMVVALTALFVALGGTGYAASALSHSAPATIAKHKHKHKPKHKPKPSDKTTDTRLFKSLLAKAAPTLSVRSAMTAQSATTATNATNATNSVNASNAVNATNATSATHATNADNASALNGNPVRWLLVTSTGTIVSQSGDFTVSAHASSSGFFVIDAGSAVDGHALVVSDAFAGDTSFRGVTVAGPCGTGADGIDCSGIEPGADDGDHILVGTTGPANNTRADHAFYLVMY